MRYRLALVLIFTANAAMASYSDQDYGPHLPTTRPQSYQAAPGMDRQTTMMNTRIQFIQPRMNMVQAVPIDRLKAWEQQPVIQPAAKPPPSFLSYLGSAIAKLPAQIGQAIKSAVMAPIRWIQAKVAEFAKGPEVPKAATPSANVAAMVNQRTVAAIPNFKPGFTPTPDWMKTKVIATPLPEQTKPKPTTTPIQEIKIQKPTDLMPVQEKVRPVTKGPGLINIIREKIGMPSHVPINKLYPEPGGDFDKRPGFDDDAVGRRRAEMINGQFKPISVIQTPKGYMISDGLHRWEAARQTNRQTVPVYIIGREK